MNKIARMTAAVLLAGGVLAAEAPQYNVISLQAEARREIQNDLAQATLYAEFSDANAAALSDRLNRAQAEAVKLAKTYPNVKVSTSGNNVYPVYNNKNKAEGWRGRAEVRLEATDFKALAELIGKLQNNMQLAGVNFGVSPALRDKVETELIDQAVQAFRNRATVVQKSVGGKGYRLVNLNVNTGAGGGPRPRVEFYAAKAAMADAAPPPMEGGDSQVVVDVSGSIQVD
ncbi:SIMPL domain-containing protein [Chitinimonas koreensis]|uniref:SIMPL domain-containing protein n=1 Tax=Chitinimonas koreensis TaxID=356302 RepID=UPI0004045070|nr:SIMPL domain-containing protein [Chitinimonas koreensis]QNM95586.1 SIMPL domain-containing protein [Chitinimonas koreensis]